MSDERQKGVWALLLGLFGAGIGLVQFYFLFAWGLSIPALVIGIRLLRRFGEDRTAATMAMIGIALALVGVALGIRGFLYGAEYGA